MKNHDIAMINEALKIDDMYSALEEGHRVAPEDPSADTGAEVQS